MDWREILTFLENKRAERVANIDLITEGGYLGVDPLDEIIKEGAEEILERERVIQRMREDYYGKQN